MKMKILRSECILILCVINCAGLIKGELPTDHAEMVAVDSKSEDSGKRVIRQVAVNVGPIGVGVGPFGGVGVRIGPWFNLGVAPRHFHAVPVLYPPPVPVAYPAPVPVVYPAPVPVAYPAPAPITYQVAAPVGREYSYSSNYHYDYSY